MGGKRLAEQVRRALILAAKVAPVAVVIDASGCNNYDACEYRTPVLPLPSPVFPDATPDVDPFGLPMRPDGAPRDSGALDARVDAPATTSTDASKDGG